MYTLIMYTFLVPGNKYIFVLLKELIWKNIVVLMEEIVYMTQVVGHRIISLNISF